MHLDLKNFYQYTQKTFIFPDIGMVRLAGISGAGKSTIMKAIDYVVNGSVIKRSWHGGIPSVTLDWPLLSLKIERYGTQTSGLTVITEDGEFRDDQAQAEIYRKLCGSQQRFSVSSYIRQRMKGALINLGPAEQLRLIQSLAFGDEDPEVTKAKVAATLKSKTDAVAVETKQLLGLEAIAADLKARASAVESTIIDPPPPCAPDQMDAAYVEFKRSIEEQRTLDAELRTLIEQIANPLYGAAAVYERAKDQFNGQKQEFEAHLALGFERERELTIEDGALVPPTWDQKLLDSKIRYFNVLEKAKALIIEAGERFPSFPGTGLGAWLIEQIAWTKTKIDEVESQYAQKTGDLRALIQTQDNQQCPECGTALAVTAGKIHKYTEASNCADRIEALRVEAEELDATLKTFKSHLRELERLHTRASELKAMMGVDPQPEIRDALTIEKERLRIVEYATSKQRIASELAAIRSERERVEKSLAGVKIKLDKLALEANECVRLVPIDVLRNKQEGLLIKIAQKGAEVGAQSALIEKIEIYNQAMQKVNQTRAVLAEIRAQQAAAEGRVAEQERVVRVAKEAVGTWTRMRELSDMAATQAVEDTINDINGNAQAYLTKLFPDDGTVVRILNSTKNQRGDEKAKLSLEILHKGFEVGKNDEDLSGGEQDRIALAFQMAMSDLYVSPILMVDEGFAGADVEKTLSIGLTLLQEYSANKLILVIQHGAPDEFFDEVIELE